MALLAEKNISCVSLWSLDSDSGLRLTGSGPQTEPDGNVLHDPKPGPGRAAGAWSAAWLVAWRDEAQDAKSGTEAECSSATRRPQPVRPRRLIYQHKLVREWGREAIFE